MNDDKKIIGKCFHCGKKFEYTIKEHFFSKHPNLISIIQIYCSPECENTERRELEKLRLERESQKPHPREKWCERCNYVPYTVHAKSRFTCPKCRQPYSWREVKKEVEENAIQTIE